MDIDTDHKKFHASVPVKPMAPRRLRQVDEPWTTENSRSKQKIPPEEADTHQIKTNKKYHINCRSRTATTLPSPKKEPTRYKPRPNKTHWCTHDKDLNYSKYWLPSRNTNLLIGRTEVVDFARNLALLTNPSLPTLVSVTNSNGQTPRGTFSSMMRTRLPTSRFSFTLNHLGRCYSNGRYSLIHRRQNCVTKCWTHLQWRRYTSASPKSPHGSGEFCPSINKWFGASAVSSITSSFDFVNGLLFMTFSVSHNTVCIMSSFMTGEDFNNASKILRIVLIIRSQTPPWWEASAGLNSHATLRRLAAWAIFARSNWARHRFSSASAPTRLVPLSDHTFCGHPLRETNLTNAFRKASVPKSSTFSRCTACVKTRKNATIAFHFRPAAFHKKWSEKNRARYK